MGDLIHRAISVFITAVLTLVLVVAAWDALKSIAAAVIG